MAKQTFTRNKPHLNIGTMGHVDHGKTTLTAAITKVLAERDPAVNRYVAVRRDRPGAGGGRARHHHQHRPRRVRDRDPALRPRRHARPRRLREEHDHRRGPGRRGDPGRVARSTGSCRRPREHVLLARRVGVPHLVVALNKADAVDDAELLDLVELEVRELLTGYGFPGTTCRSSGCPALRALAGRPGAGSRSIVDLLDAVDRYVPVPDRGTRRAVPDADGERADDHRPRHGRHRRGRAGHAAARRPGRGRRARPTRSTVVDRPRDVRQADGAGRGRRQRGAAAARGPPRPGAARPGRRRARVSVDAAPAVHRAACTC